MSAVHDDRPAGRVASIDIVRGLVMVLMAIDHVRVYSGLPAGGPSPGIFFTRWVTHFCAPAFVFLAGTSAWLYARRNGHVSGFLLTRGVWLILLELTIVRVFWTFNLQFSTYMLAGVLWVIGWSMIALAGLARLPLKAIAVVAFAIVALHNLLDSRFWAMAGSLNERSWAGVWKLLYFSFFAGPIAIGGSHLMVLYSLVPWVGVMALGYCFGAVVSSDPERRRRLCLAIGLSATASFLVLRGLNLYGDPGQWGLPGEDGRPEMPAVLSFLNTTKYPASLQFLLMTLGPTIAAMPYLETVRGPVWRWLTVFGRVPFFFYVLHLPVIHLLAVLVSIARSGSVSPWLFANHPMGNPPAPEGYVWSLGLLYLVWIVAVVLLYFPCRWFTRVKAAREDWWLGYL